MLPILLLVKKNKHKKQNLKNIFINLQFRTNRASSISFGSSVISKMKTPHLFNLDINS